MKKQILLFGFLFISWSIFAQVGINTTAPDSSAVLDLNANNKGLLIPTMTTTQREAMQVAPPATGLADGLLVYDTDYKRFYFWDTSVSKWVVLNNWRKEYTSNTADDEPVTIVLENNSNVGIGQPAPNSKLTVNGNLTVGSNTTAPANGAYVDGQVKIGYTGTNTDKLVVEGNSTTTDTAKADVFVGRGITPVGGIIMYAGSTAGLFDGTGLGIAGTKMEGWAICNNNNGTPDLRGRFVVGATMGEAANDGDYVYANSEQGGENEHTLTIAEMPKHNHDVSAACGRSNTGIKIYSEGSGGDHSRVDIPSPESGGYYRKSSVVDDPGHSHIITVSQSDRGGDQPHENRPPYYAVYYIMRIN